MIIAALRQRIQHLESKLDVISQPQTEKIPTFTPTELTKDDGLSGSAERRVFRTLSESNTLNEFMVKYQAMICNEDSVSNSGNRGSDLSNETESSYDDETADDMSVSKFVFGDQPSESNVLRAVTMKKAIMKSQWGGGSMSSFNIQHPLPDDDEEEEEDESVDDDNLVVLPHKVQRRHSQLIRKRDSEKWNVADMMKVREEMQNQLAHLVSNHVKSQSHNKVYQFSVDDPKWYAIIKKLNKEIQQWSPTQSMSLRMSE